MEGRTGEAILILWHKLPNDDSILTNAVANLKSQVGATGRVAVENVDRLLLGRIELVGFS